MNPDQLKSVDAPHLHIGFTKDELMLKTLLAMSIIALASVIIMGDAALIHILVAMGTSVIVQTVITTYQKVQGKKVTYESSASTLVAGMIVGLSMPIGGPFYMTAAVAFLTVLVFKYGQGHYFKRKYLNPAAASKAILLGLLSAMIFLEDSLRTGMIFHPHHLELNLWTDEGFLASMWIFSREEVFGQSLSATQSLYFWQTHGWIGGACGLLVLVVGSLAAYWLKYKWRIIAASMLTMTALSVIMGLATGGSVLLRIAFHVFTGSFVFMAFFMATEPQSTPMPDKSQILFGVLLAVLTFLFQMLNILGGSIYALIILNVCTPYLDQIGYKIPYGHTKSEEGGNT